MSGALAWFGYSAKLGCPVHASYWAFNALPNATHSRLQFPFMNKLRIHVRRVHPLQINTQPSTQLSSNNPQSSNENSTGDHTRADQSASVPVTFQQPSTFQICAQGVHGEAMPADLLELAKVWSALPVAVRQGFIATAQALTK